MNTCARIQAQLQAHLDHDLMSHESALVAEHLARCAECRAAHNELAALGAAARALPRELPPPDDLWPGIASRLPDRRTLRVRHLRANARQITSVSLLAAAALAAVILMARVPAPAPVADDPVIATAADGGDAAAADANLNDATLLDAAYRDVRADLAAVLDQHCDRLPAATCAEVKGSLQVLDDSAAALGEALRHGSGYPQERMLLINNYEMTIDRARGLTNRLIRI